MDAQSTLLDFIQQNQPEQAAAYLAEHPESAHERGVGGESLILAALYRNQVDVAHQIAALTQQDLCEAAALGDTDAIRSALQRGLTQTERSTDGWTPLHLAAFRGQLAAAQLLVEHGADVDALSTNYMLNTPLCAAIAGASNVDVVSYLISAGADVKKSVASGVTPLHLAASRGADAITRLLLEHGANPDATMEDGTSPAAMADARGHPSTAELLRSGRA